METLLFYIAEYLFYPVFLLGIFDAYRRKRLRVFLVSFFVSLALATVLKLAIGGARPFEQAGLTSLYPKEGQTFPSRHTALLTTMLAVSYGSNWGFFLTAVVTGLTIFLRVYLKLHWVGDIIGGVLVGLIAYGCGAIFERFIIKTKLR